MAKRKSRPELSKRLIELRSRLGETQESLARRLNVSLQTVALWETKRPPRGINLFRLSKIAEYHGHADLVKVFVDAMEDEPAPSFATLRAEMDRWRKILDNLNQIYREAGDLLIFQNEPFDPHRALRIMGLAQETNRLALDAMERNQR